MNYNYLSQGKWRKDTWDKEILGFIQFLFRNIRFTEWITI